MLNSQPPHLLPSPNKILTNINIARRHSIVELMTSSSVSAILQSPTPLAVPQSIRQSNSVVACAPFRPKKGAGIRNGSRLVCNCSLTPRGDNESKSVLDAFFLGKAVAEALNERIESTVGEVLSTLGRLQAEQQKQVQEFQDEVLERAKRTKEKAAREAKEAQGLPVKTNTTNASQVNSTSTNSPAVGPSTGSDKDDLVPGMSNNL